MKLINFGTKCTSNYCLIIENMLSKSRGDFAYTILDVSSNVTDAHIEGLKKLEPIIRVRLIK